ncbi:hypothetical protein J4423_04260 [Candidatus Pacearchaeota archaeon]|nr:hypothetical protein [Candidatus Pacearchaeota archaeon]
MNKYVVAVGPNEKFIGPLQRGSLECSWKYVKSFRGDLNGSNVRSMWTKMNPASADRSPKIFDLKYTINPYDCAKSFDSKLEAELFAGYFSRFFPVHLKDKVIVKKLEDISLKEEDFDFREDDFDLREAS